MGFGAGQIVYEDDLAKLRPLVMSKTVSTSRVNNTYAADPDLQAMRLTPGRWALNFNGFFTVANTTPKIRTRWAFSGTWVERVRNCHGPGSGNVAAPDAATPSTFRGYNMASQDAVYNASTSAAYSAFTEICDEVVVTVEGDWSIEWAQVTTTAANVSLMQASTIKAIWIGD